MKSRRRKLSKSDRSVWPRADHLFSGLRRIPDWYKQSVATAIEVAPEREDVPEWVRPAVIGLFAVGAGAAGAIAAPKGEETSGVVMGVAGPVIALAEHFGFFEWLREHLPESWRD